VGWSLWGGVLLAEPVGKRGVEGVGGM
jgi:hypothetical protein